MGKTYRWNINPFQDFLFKSIIYDADIADKKLKPDIYVGFVTMLNYMLGNEDASQYLDFEIKKKDAYFKVVGKNAISALWLSGIYPNDFKAVLESNEFILENVKYKFNPKTNKLTHKIIKNYE